MYLPRDMMGLDWTWRERMGQDSTWPDGTYSVWQDVAGMYVPCGGMWQDVIGIHQMGWDVIHWMYPPLNVTNCNVTWSVVQCMYPPCDIKGYTLCIMVEHENKFLSWLMLSQITYTTINRHSVLYTDKKIFILTDFTRYNFMFLVTHKVSKDFVDFESE